MAPAWRVLLASVAVAACANSPSTAESSLSFLGHVVEGCGAIGGCRYAANLNGPGGLRHFDFRWSDEPAQFVSAGSAELLSAGTYRVTYVLQMVSDEVENGLTSLGQQQTCSTEFVVQPNSGAFAATGVFHADACQVSVGTAD